jgi:hypothetical protein
MFPTKDGELIKNTDRKKRRYNADWVAEQQRREAALRRTPEYRFMLKVEGVTAPQLTQKHFNEDFVDKRKSMDKSRAARALAASNLSSIKMKMYTQMFGDIANSQNLRFTADSDNVLRVSTADPAVAGEADTLDSALQQLRHGRRDPIKLHEFVQNINKAVDSAMTAPADLSDLVGDEESMEWAMAPEHSGVINYTPIYLMGLSLASAKMDTLIGHPMTADEIVNYANGDPSKETISTYLAAFVGYEIIDNDVMMTGRYSKKFQARDLKEKRAMLVLKLRKAFGATTTPWGNIDWGYGAGAPWEDGGITIGCP